MTTSTPTSAAASTIFLASERDPPWLIPISALYEYSDFNVGFGTTTQEYKSLIVTPIVKGKIIDTYLYESGTGYGSSILNLEKKPIILIKNGKAETNGLQWKANYDGDIANVDLKLNDIPLSSSLKIGDTIVTGGMSFYFPKGVPIGSITNYDNSSLEGYYDIDIEVFNDFSSLSNVYILERTDNEEIKTLLND